MTGRRLLRVVVWAMALGLLLALPVGGRQRISVELWFAAVAIWMLIGLAANVIRAAPPAGGSTVGLVPAASRWLSQLMRRRERSGPDDQQLNDHRFIEALVMRAITNPRSHSRRLRPRLQAIVDHQLLLTNGIDPRSNPTRAAAVQRELLGDTAWLLDPKVTDRAPTLDELDLFLRRLNVGTDSF